jgi:hypothetical protein
MECRAHIQSPYLLLADDNDGRKMMIDFQEESYIDNLEQRIKQLESGSGGIMEMKQTIADKEKRIAELENELAGRVVWTENYGQGSEPWLNEVDKDEQA